MHHDIQAESSGDGIRVGHYYATALLEPSGVTAAIDAWAGELSAAGARVCVIAPPCNEPGTRYSVPVLPVRHLGRTRRSFIPSPLALLRIVRDLDVLVLHESWTLSHWTATLVARLAGTPVIVMPHGVYEPAIVARLRARHARVALEKLILRFVATVHVFFETEVSIVRRVSDSVNILVAPTGLRVPITSGDEPRTQRGDHVLWFGRYDLEHKGLDLLLGGLALLDPSQRPHVTLAGYDYEGGLTRVREFATSLGLSKADVQFLPRLDDHGKHMALKSMGAYAHPSRWECHSVALLEALASDIPIMVSSSIHIAPILEVHGAAALVEPTTQHWAAALADLRAKGLPTQTRGTFYHYLSWDETVRTTLCHYRSLRHTPRTS